MIISVGYRVKSHRGIEFRRWANSVLKQYLIKGYAVNEHIRKQQISELRQLVQVLGRTLQQQPVPTLYTLQGRRRLYLCARHPRRLRLSAVEHQQDHQQGDLSRHLRERYEGNQCAEREVWLLPSLRQREG